MRLRIRVENAQAQLTRDTNLSGASCAAARSAHASIARLRDNQGIH